MSTDSLKILWENKDFLMDVYSINGVMGLLLLVTLIDLIFKGWALWRAARLGKKWWFIPLLVVNSMGILPVVFLLATNYEYQQKKSLLV